jgi:hypothetical protein
MSYGQSSSESKSSSRTVAQTAMLKQFLSFFGGESGLNDITTLDKEIADLASKNKPIPPELQAQRDAAAEAVKGETYQGERVAPFSALQNQAVSGAGNYSDYFATPETTTTPMMAETGTALQGLLAGKGGATNFAGATDFTGAKQFTPEDTANYFKGAIYDPTMKSLAQDVNPATQEAFAGPGFYGAARSQALQKNATDTAANLNTARAGLEWDVTKQNQALAEAEAARRFTAQEAEAGRRVSSQDAAAGRTQTAVNQGMAYSQLPAQQIKDNIAIAASKVEGLGKIFGIGQAEQTQEQAQLQSDIQKFAEDNQIFDPELLNIMFTLLNMQYSKSSSSSSGFNVGVTLPAPAAAPAA